MFALVNVTFSLSLSSCLNENTFAKLAFLANDGAAVLCVHFTLLLAEPSGPGWFTRDTHFPSVRSFNFQRRAEGDQN